MVSRVHTASLLGLEVQEITVEVDYRPGLSSFSIVGLADRSVQESKERIISAIRNSSAEFTPKRLVVNLAPAPFHKSGAGFDLAIAVGYLLSTHQLRFNPSQMLFLGELGLDGRVHHVNGILAILSEVSRLGYQRVFIPAANYPETRLAKRPEVIPVASLNQLISHFRGRRITVPEYERDIWPPAAATTGPGLFCQIQGQHIGKRALEITAAGGHNLLLSGPPGSGKSMLASSLPEILPPMSEAEIYEVTKVYSVSGLLPKSHSFISTRPFRAPHHSTTKSAMLGGGNVPHPGEISLAHKGVLFLDEFPEFSTEVRDSLREPLETRQISISRTKYKLLYPADFSLVIAANPCKCGYFGDDDIECKCSPTQVARYRAKISGPILDRVDLKLTVNRILEKDILQINTTDKSDLAKRRIESARKFQLERTGIINSNLDQKQLLEVCALGTKERSFIGSALTRLHLSPRAFYRSLKVARTIADLEFAEKVSEDHLAEALSFRFS